MVIVWGVPAGRYLPARLNMPSDRPGARLLEYGCERPDQRRNGNFTIADFTRCGNGAHNGVDNTFYHIIAGECRAANGRYNRYRRCCPIGDRLPFAPKPLTSLSVKSGRRSPRGRRTFSKRDRRIIASIFFIFFAYFCWWINGICHSMDTSQALCQLPF